MAAIWSACRSLRSWSSDVTISARGQKKKKNEEMTTITTELSIAGSGEQIPFPRRSWPSTRRSWLSTRSWLNAENERKRTVDG
ncbi:hypothetical protein L6452_26342 [Arctium lappa]|uniref:Uncharacterized protein n=1 Tax=Arctium lappa TaxID=4217 RepID=A0ACB9AD01_ARCLA|nr:hypothetical protein L6452_26342 [Arctium lappa]